MKKLLFPWLVFALFFASCESDDDSGIQPTACFTYDLPTDLSPLPIEITFSNCSENATSYLWEFGDDTTSTETNPSYDFNDFMFPLIVKLTAYNGDKSDVLIDTIYDFMIVYKPNIYLYPEETIDLCLSLDFPLGGGVIKSDPEYVDEWCVTVEADGKIDGKYDFLFYESAQPDVWQREEGWSIAQMDLEQFFRDNMRQYGFKEHEIQDFIVYWIPLLKESVYYNIYPQEKQFIDAVIEIHTTTPIDNENRLFYVVEKTTHQQQLAVPYIKPFKKSGFYLNEWGVITN